MDIDERIGALTQSVELLSQMHQDNEKMYALLFQQLANIVQSHEERITHIEDRQNGK